MKNPFSLFSLLLLLCACSGKTSQTVSHMEIDVAAGLQNLTTLKASDFGKTIRYVPLETTDDCLIDNDPSIKVLKDKIVVTTKTQCFVFDKLTGKFISSIGHIGNDPEGYSTTMNWVDGRNNLLYFGRQTNQLVKYDFQGQYSGKIELPSTWGVPSFLAFNEESIIGYYADVFKSDGAKLAFFDHNGNYIDSINSLLPPIAETMNDIENISVNNSTKDYGNWSQRGIIILQYNNDKTLISSPSSPVVWCNNEEVRFKENFGDTIYTIEHNRLKPYLIFNTGDYYWPKDERTSKEKNNKRVIVPYVTENDKSVFFQCILGLYTDNRVLYNGLYSKSTGETIIAKEGNAIEDDISSFMPFSPCTIGTSGEYAGILEAADILDWLEKHPETRLHDKPGLPDKLTEDMNPIIVLIEP